MFQLLTIRKASEGLTFDQTLDLKASLLEREPEILDLSPVAVKGQVSYEGGLYVLAYQAHYTITLPSSRSLTPVALDQTLEIHELFVAAGEQGQQSDLIDDDLLLVLEEDHIDLEESLVDNILLDLPSRVLTPEEAADDQLPSGDSWSLMTESQYEAQKEAEKEANNPFAGLSGLFDE